ncbi:MAG: DHHA1 domain-containing protein [Campylobacterota bacterium]|nr:DHHA1 domain-containing protein [Campylobacterota bacterium]
MSTLYHLSHTDLDGYGCQYLSHHAFSKINYYNANYGPEVMAMLEAMINQIKRTKISDAMILITDLNLTTKEARWIEEQSQKLGVSLQLLDHHATGQSCANRFEWYYLDTSRSATQITYDWLQEHYSFDQDRIFEKPTQVINAVDIWLSDHKYFELGKVCLGMVSSARELSRVMFDSDDREYKLYLIEQIAQYVNHDDAHIYFDEAMHQIKKSFFKKEQNDTKDNLVASYVVDLIGQQRDRFTIHYKDKKGVLVYSVGSASIIGNRFLMENEDYDFYMDIGGRGNFSMRSSDRANVSKMAQEIGNGGGHPNASGGKLENFKSSFIYEDIKKLVVDYIENLN